VLFRVVKWAPHYISICILDSSELKVIFGVLVPALASDNIFPTRSHSASELYILLKHMHINGLAKIK
jgi:hypothetical protein